MKHLLLIYASQTGHTKTMAEAVYAGTLQLRDEVETRLMQARDAGMDELLWCDGLLIGTPENFGYMAGMIKDFFDRTYYPAQGLVEGLPYGMFISADNDGTGALHAIERIARGYPLKTVVDPIIAKGECTGAMLERCEEMGITMAAGLSCGIF